MITAGAMEAFVRVSLVWFLTLSTCALVALVVVIWMGWHRGR